MILFRSFYSFFPMGDISFWRRKVQSFFTIFPFYFCAANESKKKKGKVNEEWTAVIFWNHSCMYFRVFLKKMGEDGFQVGRIITLLKSRFKWRIHTDKCNSTNLETKVCNFSTLQILLVFSLLFALKILHKKYKGNLPLALLWVSYRFSDGDVIQTTQTSWVSKAV